MPKNSIKAPTESISTMIVATYLRTKAILFTKTAQETFTRSFSVKRRNKLEGVNPGLPDFIILAHGLLIFMELKRGDHSNHLTPEQKQWKQELEYMQNISLGKVVYIMAYGHDEAIEKLEVYLSELDR